MAQLYSPDKLVRETAAQKLSQIGDKLSQNRVNELISIMRHGNESWQTSSARNEGRHCTDYEYTSIKHYAATVLAGMSSQYVSSDVAREARKSQSDSVTTKRVTDPGWI